MDIRTVKGELACLKFDQRSLELGFISSKPNISSLRYDRIIDMDGKLFRVQIKYTNYKPKGGNAIAVMLEKTSYNASGRSYHRKGYSGNEIDAVVAYIPCLDKLCWLPLKVFENKTCVSLRLGPTKNKQVKKIFKVEDYYW